jgi:hypothetical protein
MTDRVRCNCKSEFQDETYGKGVRVATPCGSPPSSARSVRCTVCGKEYSISGREDKKSEKPSGPKKK